MAANNILIKYILLCYWLLAVSSPAASFHYSHSTSWSMKKLQMVRSGELARLGQEMLSLMDLLQELPVCNGEKLNKSDRITVEFGAESEKVRLEEPRFNSVRSCTFNEFD
jgi:hypothetical protein